MDVRYQVFVSSTFRDLTEERREVIQCLLEMDCIPAGMELFPAADDTAWKLIERVIEQSDYYILIIGGRYGSIDKSGVSYTEREYDYAVLLKKPVLPFLHQDPNAIPAGKSELDKPARDALERFRQKVEASHHAKYWNSPSDLSGKVARALNSQIKISPPMGWVRGDQARRLADVDQISALLEKVNHLLKENQSLKEANTKAMNSLIPRIATEYPLLVRRLRLYIELVPDPTSGEFFGRAFQDAARWSSSTYDELATLLAEVETTHPGVYFSGVDVLRALDPLRIRRVLKTTDVAKKWKIEANAFVAKSHNLQSLIESEPWTP